MVVVNATKKRTCLSFMFKIYKTQTTIWPLPSGTSLHLEQLPLAALYIYPLLSRLQTISPSQNFCNLTRGQLVALPSTFHLGVLSKHDCYLNQLFYLGFKNGIFLIWPPGLCGFYFVLFLVEQYTKRETFPRINNSIK